MLCVVYVCSFLLSSMSMFMFDTRMFYLSGLLSTLAIGPYSYLDRGPYEAQMSDFKKGPKLNFYIGSNTSSVLADWFRNRPCRDDIVAV